jgi:ATP-dependent DNA helicase RecG
MVDTEGLAALAADLESVQVERKASFKGVKSDIEEAICAFANDLPGTGRPGYVLLGVTDKTGRPSGLEVTDELLLAVTDIRSSGNICRFP